MRASTHYILPRDDDDGGLSRQTIIIIAVVCGSVGVLVCALFLWRLLARCCRRKESAPLPPVQDLAHRREMQLAMLSERYGTTNSQGYWLDVSGKALAPGPTPSPIGSSVSLLIGADKNGSGLVYAEDSTTAESLYASRSASDVDFDPSLPSIEFPNSHTQVIYDGIVRPNASTNSLPAVTVNPSQSLPLSEASSYSCASTVYSAAPLRPSRSQSSRSTRTPSRTGTRPQLRNRPQSQVSMRTSYTTQSFSSSRGAPHLPYSNVQIVLPAPLAPQATYPQRPPTIYQSRQPSRSSVFVDQWVTSRSEQHSRDDERRRIKMAND